ncbi:hypothetical protein BDZ97DRAFT_2020666 [Flammula alnicola]|nr:hypothetical protein BDZ97DRAFT_2020666 [Flammula alnicola]
MSDDIIHESVGLIGAGVAGLINAHVLLQDGFTDITLISRDKTVGGTWAMFTSFSIHREYQFSALDMPPPEGSAGDHRLTGVDMCSYAKFEMETEVLDIERNDSGQWQIQVEDKRSKSSKVLAFSRIILATGGCSTPKIPKAFSQKPTETIAMVIHSSDQSHEDRDESDTVLVVGGGKSAQDVCAKLTDEGRKTAIVFETTDTLLAGPSLIPLFLRKSRFSSMLSPHSTLNTPPERFLHMTTVGSAIIWKIVGDLPFKAYNISQDSPLRQTQPLFWTVRVSDEGVVRLNSFHALANSGAIEVIAPARVIGYSNEGKSLLLSDGRFFAPKVVVLATGYQPLWTSIFTPEMREEIGLNKHAPQADVKKVWKYKSLKYAPELNPENEKWVTSIYRGIIPAKNIERRDFAIAGASYSANYGYTNEVTAHWIASYFRGDKMHLPSSPQEALEKAEERCAWMRTRFPNVVPWVTESESTGLDHLTWPQVADELLEDMYLPSHRSGGNWLTWPFKVIHVKEISNLTEERLANRRAATQSSTS